MVKGKSTKVYRTIYKALQIKLEIE